MSSMRTSVWLGGPPCMRTFLYRGAFVQAAAMSEAPQAAVRRQIRAGSATPPVQRRAGAWLGVESASAMRQPLLRSMDMFAELSEAMSLGRRTGEDFGSGLLRGRGSRSTAS